MTNKKKAENLVQKFMDINSAKMSDYSRIEYPTAKQCAIITIDEIIDFVDDQMKGWLDWDIIAELKQIKAEIENL